MQLVENLTASNGIAYEATGEGPPIILVHGLAASTTWWRHNVPELARHHRVYLVDLPGFGRMRGRAAGFTLANSADWLRDFTDAIGAPHASLVGHSMGALICAHYAAIHPSRVDRLVLAAPAIGLPNTTVTANLLPMVLAGYRCAPSFLPTLVGDAARCGLPTLLRSARELLGTDIVHELEAIETPALVIAGERDPLAPPNACRAVAKAIPGAEFVVVDQAAHVLMFEAAERFNREVLRFLGDAVY
jgi:pimeloyl-ACP methyl ester carboxylesterase